MLLPLGGCTNLLLYPTHGARDSHGADRKTLNIDSGKDPHTVEFFVARSPAVHGNDQPAAYMLEFCGNGGRAEDIATQRANRWGDHPVEVWVMNYPGFGRSDGPASLTTIPGAALAAYDHLSQQAGGRPIFVAGYSLGTTVAIYVAAHRPAAGLILQSPPPIRSLLLGYYGWWNLWLLAWPTSLQVPPELDSLQNGPHAKAPAIFLLSARDETVPIKFQEMVVSKYSGEKLILLMSNATHDSAIPADEEIRLRDDLDWLWSRSVSNQIAGDQPRVQPEPR
jgi:pimeloyl-ACP methyl ester carboxylesterase